MLPTLMHFAFECPHCPGDGVIRPKRPGVDWPSPCPCEARRSFSNYQLGRRPGVDPRTIVRVAHLRSSSDVAYRVLHGLVSQQELVPWAAER